MGGGMPWARARAVGDRGEDLACAHLEALGWEVLERNWRCREGELDVVARRRGGHGPRGETGPQHKGPEGGNGGGATQVEVQA